ncbi:complexed with cef1p [Mycoemilia scoparia]|uniref:Complexed with cef1p n=1 Tax=Mycoemilia scoparia TaxID=417184 RepID=A0A9W8A586_9FUNG|nr:complexed with cef1p [Mycoemilia scoparia]
MTTAARPTLDPARGRTNAAPSLQISAKALPSHTKLKFRKPGQGAEYELSTEEMRQELFQNEADNSEKRFLDFKSDQKLQEEKRKFIEMAKREEEDDPESETDESESSSDDDDDDETEELMRELAKIKRERAEQQARKEQQRLEEEEEENQLKAASGNPLLTQQPDFSVKRRWDDDVVFKNQASGTDDKPKRRFVNDMLRSDFHRKFMNRYIH